MRTDGVTVFAQANNYTTGELSYYTRRLAEAGLVALATTNATAQMTTLESRKAVFGTNPLSFAAPVAGGNLREHPAETRCSRIELRITLSPRFSVPMSAATPSAQIFVQRPGRACSTARTFRARISDASSRVTLLARMSGSAPSSRPYANQP
ncbi:MAG TPA: Ldh family oxidoreductase, partial [Noviherbaspirillum sp.]|nr:Ldh family oxidoreductase [Noviherbaspirillum sp.]